MGENKTKKNRVFNVLLDTPIQCEYRGESYVAYPIEFVEDNDPIVRGEKSE